MVVCSCAAAPPSLRPWSSVGTGLSTWVWERVNALGGWVQISWALVHGLWYNRAEHWQAEGGGSSLLWWGKKKNICTPALTYGHKLWAMSKRMKSQIHAAKISCPRREAGHTLRNRVRSSVITVGHRVKSLLLHIEKSQSGLSIWSGCLPDTF